MENLESIWFPIDMVHSYCIARRFVKKNFLWILKPWITQWNCTSLWRCIETAATTQDPGGVKGLAWTCCSVWSGRPWNAGSQPLNECLPAPGTPSVSPPARNLPHLFMVNLPVWHAPYLAALTIDFPASGAQSVSPPPGIYTILSCTHSSTSPALTIVDATKSFPWRGLSQFLVCDL